MTDHQKPFVTPPPPKPTGLVSWWTQPLDRAQEAAWRQRAAGEVDRMCGSREFTKLGYRFAVEELGRVKLQS